MSRTVREIMNPNLVAVDARATLVEAARQMRDADTGAIILVEDGLLRGVLTDRDVVVRAVAEGKDPAKTSVESVCSTVLHTVAPDQTIEAVVALMREHALRRVPVTDSGRPVGIVSLGDLAIERDEDSALADISSAQPNT